MACSGSSWGSWTLVPSWSLKWWPSSCRLQPKPPTQCSVGGSRNKVCTNGRIKNNFTPFILTYLSGCLFRETLSPVGPGWCPDWYEWQLPNWFPWQVWWHDSSEAQLVPHPGWGGDRGLLVSGHRTYLQLWGHWQWVWNIALHKLMHLEKRARQL